MESNAKNAPTPWRVTPDDDQWSASHEGMGASCYQVLRDANDTTVAIAVAYSRTGYPDCTEISRLIAHRVNVHDKLVEALCALVSSIDAGGATLAAMRDARAAIAKATGGSL